MTKQSVPPRPRLIVFDFDGVIADSMEATIEIYNRLALSFGLRQVSDKKEIEKFRNQQAWDVVKSLNISGLKLLKLIAKSRSETFKVIENLPSQKGMPAVLQTLKKDGYTLGIVTANSVKNVRKFLRKQNLEIFDFIYEVNLLINIITRRDKDHILRKIAKIYNLSSQEVVYIGDQTSDIDSGNKAGVRTAGVGWGYNSPKILKEQNPDYFFEKPEDILKLFD